MGSVKDLSPAQARALLVELRPHLMHLYDLLDRFSIQISNPCEGKSGDDLYDCIIPILENYGIQLVGEWDTTNEQDKAHLAQEILEGVRQLSTVFYSICQQYGNCSYSSPEDLFQQVFASGYQQGIRFDLTSGYANSEGDAAMFTIGSEGRLVIGNSGRGMPIITETDKDKELITRYLVTHELMHILSYNTGGAKFGINRFDLQTEDGWVETYYGGLHFLDTQVDQIRNIEELQVRAHSFYYDAEGYATRLLPGGFNNWDGVDDTRAVEERVAELLNIFIWHGTSKNGSSLGFTNIGTPYHQKIEELLPLWLALAADAGCNLGNTANCRLIAREFAQKALGLEE